MTDQGEIQNEIDFSQVEEIIEKYNKLVQQAVMKKDTHEIARLEKERHDQFREIFNLPKEDTSASESS